MNNFCLVCGVRIQIFKAGKFCQHLNISLIIFHFIIYTILSRAPKHRTFWRINTGNSVLRWLICRNSISLFLCFAKALVVLVAALGRPLLLRRIETGVTTGKSRHCYSLAQLHGNCEIDRRMVERSSVLQRLSAHRADRHSLPLDLNSNDLSLHVHCESSNIQFSAFRNKCNYCLN